MDSVRKGAEGDPDEIHPQDMSVLIVDDDPVACQHGKLVLEKVGIASEIASSGAEAVEMVRLRHARDPDHRAEQKPEDDVEERAGKRSRDAFPRFGAREQVALAVADFVAGGIDLRQVDVAAAGDAADAVIHAVDLLAPDFLESDRKRLDVEAAELRDDEMAELVHNDAQAEKDHHQHDRCDQDQCFHIFKNSFSVQKNHGRTSLRA